MTGMNSIDLHRGERLRSDSDSVCALTRLIVMLIGDPDMVADILNARRFPGGLTRSVAVPPVGDRPGQGHDPIVNSHQDVLVRRVIAPC